MNEELKKALKKALEAGMGKFVFDRVEETLPMITKEMKKVVQSFGIEDAEVVVFQVGLYGVKAIISFDGGCIECTLNSKMASFDDIEKEKKEFEKWWDNLNVPAGSTIEPRKVWEAALEWVRMRITENLKMASFDDNVACVKHIEEDIKKELGIEK